MPSTSSPRVAIVGGGLAGSLTAAQLLRRAKHPLEICLIERRPPFGSGKAFATALPCHLLNVPAIRMSAYQDDPEHLLRWLRSRANGSGPVSEATFLPRRIYGSYVEATLRTATERSAARLARMEAEVVSIERGRDSVTLRMRDGSTLEASCAVLALGNQPPSAPRRAEALSGSPRYAPDPWDESALHGIAPDDTIVAIGSNLTMVDVALALDHRNHRGELLAVSTHGLLPLAHETRLPEPWDSSMTETSGGPRRLMRSLRLEADAAMSDGLDWRSVVDSLRPLIGSIWTSWSDAERSRFLRHARPYWEIHRHRMAPENAATIAELLRSGRLRVIAGRIDGMRETGSDVEIRVQPRGSGTSSTIRASRVVNCTGPGMDYLRSPDPLVRGLLERGLARPGPLGIGLDAAPDGALVAAGGEPSSTLYTLGPPLKGLYWETTAVPEIRVQAGSLAIRLERVLFG